MAAKAVLDKKQDVLSPIYQSLCYQWRLKLRKEKTTKKLGVFIEMLGRNATSLGSDVPGGEKKLKRASSGLFAATFSLGFSQCFEGRTVLMESAKKAVIFRPGEYQWGWARLVDVDTLQDTFVQKNNVAVRAILCIL